MTAIAIRLVTGADAVSAMIRAAELGFAYSHADVAMPEGGYLGAHAEGGVALRPVGYDAAATTREQLVAVPAGDAQAALFHGYLRAQIGKPYDLGAIAELALGVIRGPELPVLAAPWHDPARWFCSELIVAALVHAGLLPPGLPAAPRRVTPRDLAFILAGLAARGAAPALAA